MVEEEARRRRSADDEVVLHYDEEEWEDLSDDEIALDRPEPRPKSGSAPAAETVAAPASPGLPSGTARQRVADLPDSADTVVVLCLDAEDPAAGMLMRPNMDEAPTRTYAPPLEEYPVSKTALAALDLPHVAAHRKRRMAMEVAAPTADLDFLDRETGVPVPVAALDAARKHLQAVSMASGFVLDYNVVVVCGKSALYLPEAWAARDLLVYRAHSPKGTQLKNPRPGECYGRDCLLDYSQDWAPVFHGDSVHTILVADLAGDCGHSPVHYRPHASKTDIATAATKEAAAHLGETRAICAILFVPPCVLEEPQFVSATKSIKDLGYHVSPAYVGGSANLHPALYAVRSDVFPQGPAHYALGTVV